MISALILSLALLQSATPQSQLGTPKPLADEPAKCSIEGKVISATDGAALKKATLQLMPQQPSTNMVHGSSTTTDANGKFVIHDLEAGRFSLIVARNGYARQQYGERIPGGPGTVLSLVPGQTLKDVVVRLTPAAAISGRIVDEDNEPVANVRMQLARWGYRQGKRQLLPIGYGQTDDRGQFRIFGIAAGRYFVSATYQPQNQFYGVRSTSDSENSYAPTYYPGTNDVSQAMAITVHSGDDLSGYNFRLLPGRAVRISGRAIGPGGEPAKNSFLMLIPRGQVFVGGISPQSTDDKGNFSFSSVMPGSYAVIGQGGDPDDRLFGRTDIDVTSSPVDDVAVQLGRGVDLEAEVHLDGDVNLEKSTVRLGLMPKESVPMFSSNFVPVKEPGTVVLKHVADGDYNILAGSLPDDAYLSKAEFDGTDALADGLKIRSAAGPLSITISAHGGHVEGSVVDSKNQPFSGAVVALVPDESKRARQELFRTTNSDQYGHFVLRGIVPGTYKLFAWEAIDPGAYLDADFLKSYEDDGKSLQIGPGEHATPELKVISSAKTGS